MSSTSFDQRSLVILKPVMFSTPWHPVHTRRTNVFPSPSGSVDWARIDDAIAAYKTKLKAPYFLEPSLMLSLLSYIGFRSSAPWEDRRLALESTGSACP